MLALLYDTETTGLISNHTVKMQHQPHVIEFYGCLADLKTGKIKDERSFLIKPPIHIEQEITDITTITDETVKDAPSFSKVANEIFQFLEEAPIIIAHNASYDREIMDLEAERLNQAIKWPRTICTVEQTVSLKGIRLSLSDLHSFLFGEPFAGAHRAEVDVKALLRCCVALYKKDIL
jgi:DNA polymerase III epsilon subunit family exonuclease